jgi:hypothetical protein
VTFREWLALRAHLERSGCIQELAQSVQSDLGWPESNYRSGSREEFDAWADYAFETTGSSHALVAVREAWLIS